VLVHSLVLGAGLVGHLTVTSLATLLAGPLAAAVWLLRRTGRDGVRADDGAALPTGALFAPLAALVAMVVWAWPHLVYATRLWIWDDYTYHLVYPALWLREHAIAAPGPGQAFTMQAWYPLSASVVSAWFAAPLQGSRGDALAWVSLTGPLYAGLVIGGAAALLARLGCRPGAWAVPAALLVTSPRIGIMASSFSDADLAQAATLFGAFAFAVPRGTEEAIGEIRKDACYAGLLSGLALGVKVSAAPLALTVLGMLLLRARPARWRGAAGVALAVVVSWTVTGGYWYARNVVHAGNPIYPAAFLVWPGATFPETTLLEYGRHYGLRRTLGDALVVYADWPPSHALVAALGLLGLAGWLARSRRSLTRPQRYFAGGALVLTALILALLPIAPYSAGNAMTFRSGFIHWDSMRYIALAPILGWAALGFLLDLGGRLPGAILVAAALLTSKVPPLDSPYALIAVALGSVVVARLRPHGGALATPRGRALALGAGALVMATIVVSRHDAKAAATAEAFHREPLFGAAVAVLDRQPAGTRVAVFGDQWIYPTFGAHEQLVPVRLDRDGRLAGRLVGDAMEPGNLTVDSATFRANLAAAGVGIVVILHLPHPGRSADWPTQHAALETIADARLLHRDAAAAVWRLGGPP
jgi:hypothetical protein